MLLFRATASVSSLGSCLGNMFFFNVFALGVSVVGTNSWHRGRDPFA